MQLKNWRHVRFDWVVMGAACATACALAAGVTAAGVTAASTEDVSIAFHSSIV